MEVNVGCSLVGVSVRYGARVVVSQVSFTLSRGERVGLLGENGAGKSSLLRVLAGELMPETGGVTRDGPLAFLGQADGLTSEGGDWLERVSPSGARAARSRLTRALAALAAAGETGAEEYAQAEEAYATQGGYTLEGRAAQVLAGLGLTPDQLEAGLSGGQSRRVALARLLLTPASYLLLDEPTNHLDAPATAWLAGWLRAQPSGILVVSHDRTFLDAIVTRCLQLERGEVTAYAGSYSGAMLERDRVRGAQENAHQEAQRERVRLEQRAREATARTSAAGKFDARRASDGDKLGAKSKMETGARRLSGKARALRARVERLEDPGKPFEDLRVLRLPLGKVERGSREMFALSGVSLERDGRLVLSNINLNARRGERLALLGPNGSGKTTLLMGLLGQLPLAAGHLRIAPARVYWAGQNGEEFQADWTLGAALIDAEERLDRSAQCRVLASVGLPAEPERTLDSLSGGQRTRLTLARLAVTNAALLVLDEPTNNLDVPAIEALQGVLVAYPGCVVFASHDRALVDSVASRYFWVAEGSVKELGGSPFAPAGTG